MALAVGGSCAEIALKPYPCCHFTHAFVDAARDIVAQIDTTLTPDQVERIECPIAPALLPTASTS